MSGRKLGASGECLVLSRKLLTTVAMSTLAVGALAGCTATRTTHTGAQPAQKDPLAILVSDVTGSLQKVANSSETVRSVAFTMTGSGEGIKINGQGSMAFQPLTVEVTVGTGATGVTTVRFIDNVLYVKVPAAQRAELRGKTWLKLTPGKVGPFSAASRQIQDVNPVEQVKTLLASGRAKAVGRETVDGVPTVHYTATTSVATAIGQVDPQYRSVAKSLYERAGVKEITTEIWVDAQYRPRRVHVIAGTMSDLTVDYHDYNRPVTVTAPPAGDTLDMDELLKGLH